MAELATSAVPAAASAATTTTTTGRRTRSRKGPAPAVTAAVVRNRSPASTTTNGPAAPAVLSKSRRRTQRRDLSQADSGIEISQDSERSGKLNNKRAGEPSDVESPPKKARRSARLVANEPPEIKAATNARSAANATASVDSGAASVTKKTKSKTKSTKRDVSRLKPSSQDSSVRRRKKVNENPSLDESKLCEDAARLPKNDTGKTKASKQRGKTVPKAASKRKESSLLRTEDVCPDDGPANKLRARFLAQSLKEITSDDTSDEAASSDADSIEYRPNKGGSRKASKSVRSARSSTGQPESVSDAEFAPPESAKRIRAAKPSKGAGRTKKTFTKPRRVAAKHPHPAAADATAVATQSASSSHEQRLLQIARKMDNKTDGIDDGSSSQDSQEMSQGETQPTTMAAQQSQADKTDSAEARRALIMGMLKQHEDVAELSDDDEDDDEKEENVDFSGSGSTKAFPTTTTAGESSTLVAPVPIKDCKTEHTDLPPQSPNSGRAQKKSQAKKKTVSKSTVSTKKATANKQSNKDVKSSSSEDESGSDWEVVAAGRDPNYQRPDKVSVVLRNEDFLPDAKRLDMEQRMMRLINRRRKAVQMLSYHVHLLCLMAYQRHINAVLEDETLRALMLSWLPPTLVLSPSLNQSAADSDVVNRLLLFYGNTFKLTEPQGDGQIFSTKGLKDKMCKFLSERSTDCNIIYLFGLLLAVRFCTPARLCVSHHPISHRPVLLRRKDGEMVEVKPKSNGPSDSDTGVRDYFVEVFLSDRRCWRPLDVEELQVIDDPHELGAHLDQPVLYVISIDSGGAMKDLTPKYNANWLSKGKKLRPDDSCVDKMLACFAPDNEDHHLEELKEMVVMQEKQGLPKTFSEYKNHPKYALERHLLKFEAIYPRDAQVLGYMNNEPVYPRECVKLLRSADTWHRHGCQVKEGETPYNVVKARPKWDRRNECMIKDLPLEVFGEWQTEPYKAPAAKDGKVPRNKFGNVELFHPDMLPEGTVHLKLPGLHRIADELGVDCVPAVVGFEGVGRGCHAVLEGFVVCVEHKDTLEAAWEEMRNEGHKKRRERIRKRALKNWRNIIHKVMWENRVKKKYDH